MTAYDIIKVALDEVGTKEVPANSNNVKYNTWYYKRDVNGSAYPWCCVFVSWVFNKAGALNMIKKTASCADMMQWFKDKGQFIEKIQKPRQGDLVFFKFGTNGRASDHIGIVESVNGSVINTIEGNTSINSQNNGGEVMQRQRFSKIVGYGRPIYDDASKLKNPDVRYGDRNDYVKAWQTYLNLLGYNLVADGIFGRATLAAVKDYQKNKGLKPTGIISEYEWESVGK